MKPFPRMFMVVVALAVFGGCSKQKSGAAAATTTSSTPPSTSTPPSITSTSPSSTATTSAGAVPVLGAIWGPGGQAGYATVRPTVIDNGGDPTGRVTNVHWQSWGGSQATATGTSLYLAPNQIVAEGTEETATVVAFNLGTCQGKAAYNALEWYFPDHGQAFDPNNYRNICTGDNVTASGSSMCTTAQLTISLGVMQSGLSHYGDILLFKNNGPTCALHGYPGLDADNAAGVAVVHAQRTQSGYLGGLGQGVAEPTVSLTTGQTASALFEGYAPGVLSTPCPAYSTLVVTPPNETHPVRLLSPQTVCQIQIHPVVPGASGDAT